MSKVQKKLYAQESLPGMGKGLFAGEFIGKGEYITEYIGEYIDNDEAERREHTRYLFEIDENTTIDGSDESNIARYFNHFCEPNVEAELDGDRIFFYALRDIVKGEEMGIDYGEEYVDKFIKPVGCKCSTKCAL